MKLSHNWLREYIPHSFATVKIEKWLTEIGLEVEGITPFQSIKGGLKGVVTGHVLTCVKHPNADRLSLTTVNIGGAEPLQIVCGAANVAAGQKVLVATVGTTIYPAEGEPFEIKEAKVRGEKSTGMICAEDELGLGSSHEGILILPEDTQIGIEATKLFPVYEDEIIEIGLTPNRSDANCHFGTARDLWAALKIHENYDMPLVLPGMVDPDSLPEGGDFSVEIRSPELCTRYTGLEIKNVTIGDSPEWLQNRLKAIGQKPVNNVVDVTNYVMFELGQPLHAFDATKIPQKKIIVTQADSNKAFVGLDGSEKKLVEDDLVIADHTGNAMCIAGVYGAQGYGVSNQTTHIFLESACFSPASIRRTSLRHNLRTESASHFEKGTDPNMCTAVLMRATYLICKLCGGEVSSAMYDIYPNPVAKAVVDVSPQRINRLLGQDIPNELMINVLNALNMDISKQSDSHWQVTVPGYKTDVLREADIAEEVGRIYGLNNIPPSSSFHFAVQSRKQINTTKLREQLLGFLTSNGFNEVMGMSIIDSKWWQKVSGFKVEQGVRVNNTSNIHLDLMRPDALASALEIIRYNQARQQDSLRMYEYGRVYSNKENGVEEKEFISIFTTGKYFKESWQLPSGLDNDFYLLKGIVCRALNALGLESLSGEMAELHPYFSAGYHILLGDKCLATVGIVNPALCQNADINQEIFFAMIEWQAVISCMQARKTPQYQEFSRFPMARRDLALVVDEAVTFAQLTSIIEKCAGQSLIDVNLFDEYRHLQHVGEGKKSYAVSMTLANREKTWSDQELDGIITKVVTKLKSELGVDIRK